MQKRSRSKAFTLTELLVVVVVIGVLAGVGIPKFNQVMETRRTAEAESLMLAVRSEQEKRCTFDKPYAESFEKLPGVVSVNNPDKNQTRTASANYTYYLDNSGMYAQSNKRDYQLKMQSYAAGGVCCAGAYCNSLNKSYSTCGATPADGCATEVPGCQNPVYFNKPENACECEPTSCRCPTYAAANPCICAKQCDPGQTTTSACSQCGTQKKVCNSSCQWPSAWDTSGCSNTKTCSCSSFGLCGTPSVTSTCGTCSSTGCVSCCSGCSGSSTEYNYDYTSESQTCNTCGTQTRSASRSQSRSRTCNCNDWSAWSGWSGWSSWSWGGWGSCSVSSSSSCSGSECSAGQTQNQTCNTCGTQTRSCSNGWWGSWSSCSVSSSSSCSKECPAGSKPSTSQGCGNCGTQTRSVTCNSTTGAWSTGSWGTCTGSGACASGATESQACPSGQTGNQTRTCSGSCAWGAWNTSACKAAAECTEGATQGSQACGKCGTQSTQKCVDGKWTNALGSCTGERGVCVPGETEIVDSCNTPCYIDKLCAKNSTIICSSSCQWKIGAQCYSGPWYCCQNSAGKNVVPSSTTKCPSGFQGPYVNSDPWCGSVMDR